MGREASSIRYKYAPVIFSHETINSYNMKSIDMMSGEVKTLLDSFILIMCCCVYIQFV